MRLEGLQRISHWQELAFVLFEPLLSQSGGLRNSLDEAAAHAPAHMDHGLCVRKDRHGVDALLQADVHQVDVGEDAHLMLPLLRKDLCQRN